MEQTLRIVPFYCGATIELVDPLVARLTSLFRTRVERRPPAFDPETAFDSSRGQYDSRILLAALLRCHAEDGRVLGITDVDLFIPVLTFVFGEAQLSGRVALVSSHRLGSERYGLPPDRRLLEERLLKETVHELGHTFGLVHCLNSRCVMASSQAVEAVDAKSHQFCDRCADRQARAAAEPLPPAERHPPIQSP